MGDPSLVDRAAGVFAHRGRSQEAARVCRRDYLHRYRRFLSGCQSRCGGDGRFVRRAASAQGAGGRLRRSESLGRVYLRTARCRQGPFDRGDRHLQVGDDDRTGRGLPHRQGGDRTALRQGRGRRAYRGHYRPCARCLEDVGRQRGLRHLRHSRRCGRPVLGAHAGGIAAAGRRRCRHRGAGTRRRGDGACHGRAGRLRGEPRGGLRHGA